MPNPTFIRLRDPHAATAAGIASAGQSIGGGIAALANQRRADERFDKELGFREREFGLKERQVAADERAAKARLSDAQRLQVNAQNKLNMEAAGKFTENTQTILGKLQAGQIGGQQAITTLALEFEELKNDGASQFLRPAVVKEMEVLSQLNNSFFKFQQAQEKQGLQGPPRVDPELARASGQDSLSQLGGILPTNTAESASQLANLQNLTRIGTGDATTSREGDLTVTRGLDQQVQGATPVSRLLQTPAGIVSTDPRLPGQPIDEANRTIAAQAQSDLLRQQNTQESQNIRTEIAQRGEKRAIAKEDAQRAIGYAKNGTREYKAAIKELDDLKVKSPIGVFDDTQEGGVRLDAAHKQLMGRIREGKVSAPQRFLTSENSKVVFDEMVANPRRIGEILGSPLMNKLPPLDREILNARFGGK